MQFRIGIHLGDVATDGTSLYGDGVNIAARLERLAEPGGICISAEVHGQVRGRIEWDYEDLGDRDVKNIPHPVRAFRLIPVGTGSAEGRAHPRPSDRTRWTATATAAVIGLLAVGSLVFWGINELLRPASVAETTPSIAVLPFVNLSADPANEYFSDGLSEEILNSLSQLQGLKVAARTSSFAFKNQRVDLVDVGRQLGVSSLLEGSVRKQGNRVRITAQLIKASDGYHIWSQSYDRELNDVFAIQAEIAHQVAEMLQVTLLDSDMRRMAVPDTQNRMAYDKYLWGLQLASQFSVVSVLEAVEYFREATELDPGYAKAHAGVASALAQAYTTSAISTEAFLSGAAQHAERALQLDPELSEAHSARGALLDAKGEAREAEAAYRRALELNAGNGSAAFLYGNLLVGQHRFEEALDLSERALERSPLDATLLGQKGWAHAYLGDSQAAQASYARARAVDASNPFGYFGPGFVAAGSGEIATALDWFERSARVDPSDAELFAWVATLQLSLDDTNGASLSADEAMRLNPNNRLSIATRSLAYRFAGEQDRALALARRGLLPETVPRFGNTIILLRIIRDDLLARGRIDDAIDAYLTAFPTLEGDDPFRDFHSAFPQYPRGELARAVIDLAHLQQLTGDATGATRLIRLVRAEYERDSRMGYLWMYGSGAIEVELALLEGRYEVALDALTRPPASRWSVSWRWEIEQNPIYDPIREEPRYRALIKGLERHAVEQRQVSGQPR